MVNIHNNNELEALRKKYSLDPHIIKKFRSAFYKRNLGWEKCLSLFPEEYRQEIAAELTFSSLSLHERHDSKVDGSTKLVLMTQDNLKVESVIMRLQTGRTSLCISSQIGCPVNCKFCATGQMDFKRNLKTSEILDQIILANHILREEDSMVKNVVFMGMGEPLANTENVFPAIEKLISKDGFYLPPAKIQVSTSGLIKPMKELAARFPQIGIALSLHSVKQKVRENLIPVAKNNKLVDLKQTLKDILNNIDKEIMLEYLLLHGINDSESDLQELLGLCREIRNPYVNLIAYNEVPSLNYKTCPPEIQKYFSDTLKEAGIKATNRYSLGADIAAACGQLAN